MYLSKSKVETEIVELINERTAKFYSVHNNGSSAAKIMDEELFLTKLLSNGKVKFQFMSLEEPVNADANGLKASLDKSLSKLNLSVPHEHCEIGMRTDVAKYRLVKEEVSEQYMLMLCPAHKIELAISDAFKEYALNDMSSQNYINIFYLFRRANLR